MKKVFSGISSLAIKGVNFSRKILIKIEIAILKFRFAFAEDYSLVRRNKDLVNKYKGEDCFILGCGPSVGLQDLNVLEGKNVISLSTFFYHKDYSKIKPFLNLFSSYYFHKDSPIDFHLNYFADLEKYAIGPLMLPEGDKEFIEKHNFLQGRSIRYYKWGNAIRHIMQLPPSVDKYLHGGNNIAVFALEVAISLGFKNIYLLGLDHTWIMQLKGKSYSKFETDKDSYYVKTGKTDFDDFAGDKFSGWIDIYHKMWFQYEMIKKFAEKKGVNIINLTPGSLLDVFEFGSLSSITKTD